jgi:hypothetical protein
MTTERLIQSWILEVKYEFLKMLRMPAYSIFTLLFPLMFYVFFGLVMGPRFSNSKAAPMASYLISTYGTFGVMGVALFGFGVGLSVERGQGWLQLKRASTMPAYSYLTAKAVVCMFYSTGRRAVLARHIVRRCPHGANAMAPGRLGPSGRRTTILSGGFGHRVSDQRERRARGRQ